VRIDNPSLLEGSTFSNLVVAQGTAFPVTSLDPGELFFRTDEDKLYVYTGTAWVDTTAGSSALTDANHIDTNALNTLTTVTSLVPLAIGNDQPGASRQLIFDRQSVQSRLWSGSAWVTEELQFNPAGGNVDFGDTISTGGDISIPGVLATVSDFEFTQSINSGTFEFRVRDGAGVENTGLIITGEPRVGIGTAAPLSNLHVADGSDTILRATTTGLGIKTGPEPSRGIILQEEISSGSWILQRNFSNNGSGPGHFAAERARGTAASPVVVQDNDVLLRIRARGYDGTDYEDAAYIQVNVDGTPASVGDATDMPGRIGFYTTPDGGDVPLERMIINRNGQVGIGTDIPDGTLHVQTASAGAVTARSDADDLVVEVGGSGGMSILAPDAATSNLFFGQASNNDAAVIQYSGASSTMIIGGNSSGTSVQMKYGSYQDGLILTDTGDVGIGTTNPTSKLQIGTGTTGDSNYITIGKGFDVASGINWLRSGITDATIEVTAGESMRFILDEADALTGQVFSWVADGAQIMRLTDTGQLGLGRNPAVSIDVEDTTDARLRLTVGGINAQLQAVSGEARLAGGGTAPLVFYTNGTEQMRVNSPSGFVGINETSPENRLHIRDDEFNGVAGDVEPLQIQSSSTEGKNTIQMGVGLQYGYIGVDRTGANAGIDFIVDLFDGTSTRTERFRIQETGQVVIGADLNGTSLSNSDVSIGNNGLSRLSIASADGLGAADVAFYFGTAANDLAGTMGYSQVNDALTIDYGRNGAADLVFDAAGAERMRLTNAGQLDLSTGSAIFEDPGAQNIRVIGRAADNGGQIWFYDNDRTTATSRIVGGLSDQLRFYVDTTSERLRITNGSVSVFGTFSTDSNIDIAGEINLNRVGGGIIDSTDPGSPLTLRGLDAGSALRNLARFDPDGASILYHAGIIALQTGDSGVQIRDTSGTLPIINLAGDNGVTLAQLFHNGGDGLYLRSISHGDGVRLQGEDAGGTLQNIFIGDPDGNFELYRNGELRLSSFANGITLTRPTAGAMQLINTANGANIADLTSYNINGGLTFRTETNGNATLYQTDGTGGIQDTWMTFARDGAVTLHHNSTEVFSTDSDGVNVVSGNIDFTEATTSVTRGIRFNGNVAISAGDAGDWLRLNQSQNFSNGVYTPGDFRIDGELSFGSGGRALDDVTGGQYGTVSTRGNGLGGYDGYSIHNRWVFMGNANECGIYNDIDNEWMLYGVRNGSVQLRHDGSEKIATSAAGIQVTGDVNATGNIQASGSLRVDGARGIRNITGGFGTVQTSGAGVGGYEGFSIEGRTVFMDNGTTAGIYNDTDNEWMLQTIPNGAVVLFHNGIEEMRTTTTGIQVTGNIVPPTDNTGNVGTAALTWAGGQFTNLTVDNTINVRGAIDLADNDILRFGSADDCEMFTNGTHMYMDLNPGIGNFYIRDGTTIRYTFDDNGDFTATGNVTANSDIRLKDNLEVIPDALKKVEQLNGYTYDLKERPGERFTGVVAQELEEVLPEAVGENEEGIKNVAYGNMAGLFVEAIKELNNTVKEQQAMIAELRRELEELKK
jgi:hypothetical protein